MLANQVRCSHWAHIGRSHVSHWAALSKITYKMFVCFLKKQLFAIENPNDIRKLCCQVLQEGEE